MTADQRTSETQQRVRNECDSQTSTRAGSVREDGAFYRTLFENAVEGIFRSTPAGRFTQVNPALVRLLGYDSAEEVFALHIPTDVYVSPQDREQVQVRLHAHGILNGVEVPLKRKNGERIVASLYARAIRDLADQIIAYEGSILDVTERRNAETRFRVTFEQAAVGMAHVDLEGHYLLVNQKLCDIFGYTQDELVHHTCPELTHPDDREATLREVDLVVQGKIPAFSLEKRVIRKDGTPVWVALTSAPVRDPDGAILYFVDVIEDISGRKEIAEARERLVSILENTSDFVATLTLDGRALYINRAGRELVGLDPEANLLTWPAITVFTKEFAALVLQEGLPTALRNGVWARDGSVVRQNGEILPVSLVMLAHRGDDGRVHYLSAIARDVSEHKRAEEALRALPRHILRAQEEERAHLARELHDELGQVLSALKLTLQGGQRKPMVMAERVEEGIAMVHEALEQVRQLSRDLRPAMLDQLGLVPTLHWVVAQHAKRTGAQPQLLIEMSEDERVLPQVETVCFRVVQEALTNILRHARAQKVQVELRHWNGVLNLTIRDNGVGFDVDSALSRAVEGASSGLLGMRERVCLAGGYLSVTSSIGKGTEIHARFPSGPNRK
ncbi:MAG: PAS domain S-box protein [Candidatus Binatia bacterium]